MVKNPPANAEDEGLIPGSGRSSVLAWRIPWTEGPSGLQSMGLQRVGHDLLTEHELTYLMVLVSGVYFNNFICKYVAKGHHNEFS